ncbi:Copper amine oxidase 1 [Orchesella cincta]|uniref:Amine oxidase n=1 Tax=Orchesella cincta TaxID=48709 RepID=A0A1D2M3M7_ORCCI|nr:Copper amine oxidase 1 [Orchesella cincta]
MDNIISISSALRLDAEIDGNQNSVATSDVVPGPGETGSSINPYGQAFTNERTTLRTAGQARTKIAPERSRTWVITNPQSIHPYTKQPVGWKLMPWASPPLLLRNDSPIHPQAEWMDYNTWVTPYHDDQMFPGGYYLNNSGLPEWVGRDENANIENTDVVLWHNFGLSHVPRVEDFPVMPEEHVSIMLKPYNFFKENPALDVRAPPLRSKSEL